jgi:hypothetical protein
VNTSRTLLLMFAMLTLAVSAWAQAPVADEIRPIGDLRRGEFVAVRGEVIRFRDHDEVRLQDSTGRVDVYRNVSGALPTRNPFSPAIRIISRASASVAARGFSVYTCFPAASAAML